MKDKFSRRLSSPDFMTRLMLYMALTNMAVFLLSVTVKSHLHMDHFIAVYELKFPSSFIPNISGIAIATIIVVPFAFFRRKRRRQQDDPSEKNPRLLVALTVAVVLGLVALTFGYVKARQAYPPITRVALEEEVAQRLPPSAHASIVCKDGLLNYGGATTTCSASNTTGELPINTAITKSGRSPEIEISFGRFENRTTK